MLDLNLQEALEEVTLLRTSLQHPSETFLVSFTCHEGRTKSLHKDLSELAIPFLHNFFNYLVIAFEEGLDQIELLVPLPETLHFLAVFEEACRLGSVCQFVPQLLFEVRVRQAIFAHLGSVLSLVGIIACEHLAFESDFGLSVEASARKVKSQD